MVKKVVLGTLLAGLIVILVAGGIIRTVDRTGNVAEARESGQGRGRSDAESYDAEGAGRQGGGNSRGTGQGQAADGAVRQYPNYEGAPQGGAPDGGVAEEWDTFEGTVVQAPADGTDLVIALESGEELVVGTGPGYMETQGFALQAGEQVRVYGYWEDDELKAGQITRLRDGETITLRDELGRPAWAGSGKRSAEGVASAAQGGQGQGGQGQGQGSSIAPDGTASGTGQADVSEWLTVEGLVVSADASAMVVSTTAGQEIVVEGRGWRFAQEQGFWAQAGDQVNLVGFDEDGEFEVGQIGNDTSGQVVQIREENGRPLWAGRGQRGG